MQKSITKNYIYNILLQIVNMLLPLIIVPYISRVLGKDAIGEFSYTLSVVTYFVLFGCLGINIYGSRQIAYVKEDKEVLSKTFWSITLLKAITTIIALIIYLSIFSFSNKYRLQYILQAINILVATVDITWLYIGVEDFKKNFTRGILIKIMSTSGIFLLVKSESDIYIYIILNSLVCFLGNLMQWRGILKIVDIKKVKLKEILVHLMPSIKLFISIVAIQFLAFMDKTMLGIFSDMGQVGYYEQSQRIINLALAFITAFGTVIFPRMSSAFKEGNQKKLKEYLNFSLKITTFFAVPISIGIIAISKEFVPWFFGDEFLDITYLLYILPFVVILMAISNIMMQLLIATNKEKLITISVISGIIVNLFANMILIIKFKSVGACFGSLLAEFTIMFIQYLYLKNIINQKKYFKSFIKYIISSLFMFLVIRLIGSVMGSNIITTLIQCAIGCIIYEMLLIVFKEDINKKILNKVLKKR